MRAFIDQRVRGSWGVCVVASGSRGANLIIPFAFHGYARDRRVQEPVALATADVLALLNRAPLSSGSDSVAGLHRRELRPHVLQYRRRVGEGAVLASDLDGSSSQRHRRRADTAGDNRGETLVGNRGNVGSAVRRAFLF